MVRNAKRTSGGKSQEVSNLEDGSQRSVPKENALRTAFIIFDFGFYFFFFLFCDRLELPLFPG